VKKPVHYAQKDKTDSRRVFMAVFHHVISFMPFKNKPCVSGKEILEKEK